MNERQHISDAAWEKVQAKNVEHWLSREQEEQMHMGHGLMLVTFEEWDALEARVWDAEEDSEKFRKGSNKLIDTQHTHILETEGNLLEANMRIEWLTQRVAQLEARIERSRPVFPGTAEIERKRAALLTTPNLTDPRMGK